MTLYIDPTALQRGPAGAPAKLEKAAQQFEAIMLKELVKHAVPKAEDGADPGLSTYSDMLAEQLAGSIAESGQLGIAETFAGRLAPIAERPAPPAPQVEASSGFGMRVHPITGERHFHAGVDVPLAIGTPLAAPMGGVVSRVSNSERGGLSVTLDHGGGRTTTYRHLDGAGVSEGDRIEAGQVFARSGNSGRTTGPHLHLEAREGLRTVDPSRYLRRIVASGPGTADFPQEVSE